MLKRTEVTSKKVAAIAGYILQWLGDDTKSGKVFTENVNGDLFLIGVKTKYVTVADLRALAASCLTQTADTPKRAAKRKVKK